MSEENGVPPQLTWKCSHCGHTVSQDAPPTPCPSCGDDCEFINVTCYLPDCGDVGSGNIDPRLK